jgi:hypothetical protein
MPVIEDVRQQKKETERKIQLATTALAQLAATKQQTAAWGQVSVKPFWENGYLKAVEINDTTTIKELPR